MQLFASSPSPSYLVEASTHKIIKQNSAAENYNSKGKLTCFSDDGKTMHECLSCPLPCVVVEVKKRKEAVVINRTISVNETKTETLKIYGYPIYKGDSTITQVIECVVEVAEISTSHQAEEAPQSITPFNTKELAGITLPLSPNVHLVANSSGTIIYASPSVMKVLGYSLEEIKGHNVSILSPAFQYDEYSNYIKQHLPSKTTQQIEKQKTTTTTTQCLAVKKNGEIFTVMLYMGEAVISGRPLFTGIIEDITAQKETEQLLMQKKEKAERATKLKDKFVSLVSHDLKGPIGAIIGYANLLLNEEVSLPEAETRDILRGLSATAHRSVALIEQLLTISRLKLGIIKPDYLLINSKMIVDIIFYDNILRAKEKGIKLENLIDEREVIFADQALIGQVISNIVTNAIKFCDKNDVITAYQPDGEPHTIAVKDTGRGISEKNINDIFNYEIKTSTAGTHNEIGNGMGLPLCKDMVEAHNGTLTVESAIGKGTTFYVKLPPAKTFSG